MGFNEGHVLVRAVRRQVHPLEGRNALEVLQICLDQEVHRFSLEAHRICLAQGARNALEVHRSSLEVSRICLVQEARRFSLEVRRICLAREVRRFSLEVRRSSLGARRIYLVREVLKNGPVVRLS